MTLVIRVTGAQWNNKIIYVITVRVCVCKYTRSRNGTAEESSKSNLRRDLLTLPSRSSNNCIVTVKRWKGRVLCLVCDRERVRRLARIIISGNCVGPQTRIELVAVSRGHSSLLLILNNQSWHKQARSKASRTRDTPWRWLRLLLTSSGNRAMLKFY